MSLLSDSESSNSTDTVFGSSRVLPNSPTPYTDATQTKKNSPYHIKRPMNAFMVFSHHERKKVVSFQPEIHNTQISKELGRRWKNLPREGREPFVQEAERLRELHLKEYPDYKYRPSKRKTTTRTKLALEENQKVGSGGNFFRSSSLSSWTSGMSRLKISTGQRGVLKSIDHNRTFNSFTIDRKFKDALKKRVDGSNPSFLTLTPPSATEGCGSHYEPSPPCKVPYSPGSAPWTPHTPDPFYSPSPRPPPLQYSPDSPRTVPVSPLTTRSCPITPLNRPGFQNRQSYQHPLAKQEISLTRPPSPLFSSFGQDQAWDPDTTSLPDLSACLTDIFPTNNVPNNDNLSDIKLDWPMPASETETIDPGEDIFGDNWLDNGLMAYVTQD